MVATICNVTGCENQRGKPSNRKYKMCGMHQNIHQRYGLTGERFESMWEKQKGKCAICSKELIKNKNGGRAIDHNHITKALREILCTPCNTRLGLIENPPQRYLNYIERHGATNDRMYL